MSKEGQPPRHEFWLMKHPLDSDENERSKIYRVALGDLIDARDRQTFPPPKRSYDINLWNKSGSIGYMDLKVGVESVPKKGAKPYRGNQYSYSDCENMKVLMIWEMGIEPPYRGHLAYLGIFHQRATEIAREWDLDTIVLKMIQNPKLEQVVPRVGYTLYEDDGGGSSAVKRLEKLP